MSTTDPQDELLTQVDKHNKVIGPIARGEAHSGGFYYRTIYVLVKNSHGRILLQQRSSTKDLYPSCWDLSVGGHVSYGDSYLNTAIRELREELGLSARPQDLTFLKEILVTLPSSFEFFHVFEYHLKPTDKLILATEEVSNTRWVKIQELINWIKISPSDWYPRPLQILSNL